MVRRVMLIAMLVQSTQQQYCEWGPCAYGTCEDVSGCGTSGCYEVHFVHPRTHARTHARVHARAHARTRVHTRAHSRRTHRKRVRPRVHACTCHHHCHRQLTIVRQCLATLQIENSYCWSSANYKEHCCGKPCDAAAAITNGVASPCTSSLVSNTNCNPTCNGGYTLSGYRYCSAKGGSLTSTAACNPNPCTITAPTNGALGACPLSLESGSSCTPSCNTGYVQTAGGTYSCSLGVLSGTVMCTATPRCAPYNKRTLWPGEHVWELSGFTP
jgi:hypothetical protein